MNDISYYVLSALVILLTLTIHEYCHGYAAYKLGDNTARSLGRLSLNPIKHLDPAGALCMLLFHFGWAKPVPINPRNFKNPKRDFALVALAGPLSNLIFAFISTFFYLLLYSTLLKSNITSKFLLSILENSLLFLSLFHSINIGLAVFNLLPVPPLDGSRLLNVILPPRLYFGIMKYEKKIYWALVGWLLLGGYVADALMRITFVRNSAFLSAVAGIFSLSDILSKLFSLISKAMIEFWLLLPIF